MRASRVDRAGFFEHFVGHLECIEAGRDSAVDRGVNQRIRTAEAYSIRCAGLEGPRS